MKQRLKFLLFSVIYWFLYFVLWKLVFMIYHNKNSFLLTFSDWFNIFRKGSIMDLSVTFYIIVPVILFILLISFFSKKAFRIVNKVYTVIVAIAFGLVYMIDLELYRHWKIRLDATPLKYMTTPAETLGSADLGMAIFVFLILLIITFLSLRIYFKKISKIIESFEKFNWKILPGLIFLLAFSIIPIRGGIGIAPLNIGFVYFHKTNIFANHAAVNPVWNVVKSLLNLKKNVKINYVDNETANKNFELIYSETNSSVKITNISKPNIIIIILESFYSKFIDYKIDNYEVTPKFNLLKKEGIFFSEAYATGVRTDNGVPGILSGYPAHPLFSIVTYSTKIEKLPFLFKDLKAAGYSTQWVYGGDNNFANFNSYLVNSGFDNIKGLSDYSDDEKFPKAKWGVHDEFILNEFFSYCNSAEKPFAKLFLSLSNHEPFELPRVSYFEGEETETKFLNTAFYTDSCVFNFIENAKKQSWWDSTLIFITADHGTFKLSGTDEFDKQHIPLLIIGGALTVKDTLITKIVNQTDIAYSILNQLDMNTEKYIFSKDIFNPVAKSFAFFTYNNGFGYITDSCKILFDNNSKSFIKELGFPQDADKEISKSYFQFFINDFNSK